MMDEFNTATLIANFAPFAFPIPSSFETRTLEIGPTKIKLRARFRREYHAPPSQLFRIEFKFIPRGSQEAKRYHELPGGDVKAANS